MTPQRGPAAAAYGALVADPGRALICLDYDGTLAPIALDPANAHPHPGVRSLLGDLSRTVGTVAVLTGRPAVDAVAMLGLDAPDTPAVHVRGLYGRQRWTRANGLRADPPPPCLPAARAEVRALLGATGLRLEDKGASLAVHARGLADPDAALAQIAEPLADLAARHGLLVHDGRLVRELLAPGPDKGAALRDLIADTGARAALYAGDDAADLPAFAALRDSGVPGLAIAVANPENPAVAQAADLLAADTGELLRILTRLMHDMRVG
jgi:trehalose 6-phosphate phosphatase